MKKAADLPTAEFGGELWTTNELLDAIKKRYDLPSNYAIAAMLDVEPQTVDRYRKNLSRPSAEVCEKIAKLLGQPVDYVAVCIELERARSESGKKIWKSVAKKLAPVVVVGAYLVSSSWFNVSPLSPAWAEVTSTQYYVKWIIAVAVALFAAFNLVLLSRPPRPDPAR